MTWTFVIFKIKSTTCSLASKQKPQEPKILLIITFSISNSTIQRPLGAQYALYAVPPFSKLIALIYLEKGQSWTCKLYTSATFPPVVQCIFQISFNLTYKCMQIKQIPNFPGQLSVVDAVRLSLSLSLHCSQFYKSLFSILLAFWSNNV